ncbi:hypothetical protein TWF506_010122 [Arthrobotrys conoides]|uniref:Uncharacterized protein n=1 Tax=Arthrobotrys conoides TaxID=74498 RepID=A0AAN8NJT8_9PEZI
MGDDDRGVFNLYMDDTNSIPTSLETVGLNGIDVADVTTSSVTETGKGSPSTGSNPTTAITSSSTPQTTSTSRRAGITATSNTQTASITPNPSNTSASTRTGDESSSSSTLQELITLVNDAYHIIASLGYQWYCSSLLDSVTTFDETSTTKPGIQIDVSTVVQISTSSYQPPADTDYTVYILSSGIASSATTVQNTVPDTGWRKGMKVIRAERQIETLRPRSIGRQNSQLRYLLLKQV